MADDAILCGPQPGDVFREYSYRHLGLADDHVPPHIPELDPDATHPIAVDLRRGKTPRQPAYLWIDDLECTTRAEIAIEYWGGHAGTHLLGCSLNGSDWLPMPAPQGTSTPAEHYYRTLLGNPAVPIPLELLREGLNEVRFAAGAQSIQDFGCGFFWVYHFTVRVYYDGAKLHPSGYIVEPLDGATLGENPHFRVQLRRDSYPVAQVDFIGEYEDFDWEGNGCFRQWHYHLEYGTWRRYMAQARSAPYAATWQTVWVPDQTRPMRVMARISDARGTSLMTPAVEGLTLRRPDRSVRMYRSCDVPEAFGSRMGRRMHCTIDVPDDPARAKAASLLLSTWCGAHGDEIGLNGGILLPRVGRVHDYSFDRIPVPVPLIHQGPNEFHILSHTEHHAIEVNWPGPVLLIEY